MHLYFLWPEIECPVRGQYFFCIKKKGGKYSMTRIHSQPESPAMEWLKRVLGFIPCAFRVNAHMHSHRKHFFHFVIAGLTAFLAFPVDQYRTALINDPEQGDLRHFNFGNGLIDPRDTRGGERDIHESIMVTYHDIILTFFEMLFSFEDPADPGQGKKKLHPYPGNEGERSGLSGFFLKPCNQERNIKDQHSYYEYQYSPDSEYSC